jgi:hypothetical protein
MDAALRKLVRERAEHRCEYCRIHQYQDPFFTFPIDHIIARQHGGKTEPDNLCLSCYRCNLHKGPNIASIDSDSGEMVPLFHPRRDKWHEHFEWNGTLLVGRTPVGRATVALLAINNPDYILLRESLMVEGSFPPNTQ